MSERDPLLPNAAAQDAPAEDAAQQAQPRRLGFRSRKTLLWSLGAAIALVAIAAVLYFVPFGGHGNLQYEGENISWQVCGTIEGSDVECSRIDVPMDHFDKTNSSDGKTFSIPLARLRGYNNATKNILLNPGGPGGSGVNFLYRKGKAIQQVVGKEFHLLTFDPRGINGSYPQAVCFPDSDTRRKATAVEMPNDPAEAGSLYGWAGNLARSCKDTMGEHGQYINTPQTAADMNSILDAVGQEHMYYWGFSYGTVLGQTYANMFPERSERVIVDGVVNHFDWYNSTVPNEDFVDSDNVLHGFFDECIKAGNECPLSGFGNNAKSLQKNVTAFIETLKDDPYPVYINNTLFGTLNYRQLWGAYFSALYKPIGWYDLADVTAKLMRGNGTAAFLEYGVDGGENLMMEHNLVVTYNDGQSGQPAWPSSKEKIVKKMLKFLETQSSFAASSIQDALIRAQWTIPKGHHFSPDEKVKTRHPVLVLSNTYDPICPLQSAKVARGIFKDARLVEVEAYGHCSLAMPSLCLAGHVKAFFHEGTLPSKDVKCATEGPYFINPDKDQFKLLEAADPEQEALLAALRELADSVEVPMPGWR